MDGIGSTDFFAFLDNSSWVVSSSPTIHETMVNFAQDVSQGKRQKPIGNRHQGSDEEEISMEKKRRLTAGQVEFLEKSFVEENKLEPDRKMQLANQLGLQPRQVAIWFQNRRARFKIKQLEKDYDSLKATYVQLKGDYDSLYKEKETLQIEVKQLTNKLKQKKVGWATSDPNSRNNQAHSEPHDIPTYREINVVTPNTNIKQAIEDASTAKSDVFDTDDPHCTRILDPEKEGCGSMMTKTLLFSLPNNNNNNNNNNVTCNLSLVDQPFWCGLY